MVRSARPTISRSSVSTIGDARRRDHLLHRLFNGFAERLENLDPRVVLVFGLDQCPRRMSGAGLRDHLVHGMRVEIPFLSVPPIFFGDLETLPANRLALLEAAQLLF